jgi:hypothetical protein
VRLAQRNRQWQGNPASQHPRPAPEWLLPYYGLQDRDGFVFQIIEYQASMISAIAAIAAGGEGRYRTMVHRWGCHPDHAAAALALDHARDLQEALIT